VPTTTKRGLVGLLLFWISSSEIKECKDGVVRLIKISMVCKQIGTSFENVDQDNVSTAASQTRLAHKKQKTFISICGP